MKPFSSLEDLSNFIVASHESLGGGGLSRAQPQLTWSRRFLDQVGLPARAVPAGATTEQASWNQCGPLSVKGMVAIFTVNVKANAKAHGEVRVRLTPK
ncbi:hypothetical protein HLI_01260 [Halobacillus litoralis]|uniref:Uncharacterized protein n=1 Tax=Halobacillus litoralis TaxID=45668 RepID=A0A410M897_9BACI|nr:hypothetical protein HLI_01260 [Halobacillus litoralis]